ncbi:MAG: SdpI family protein [Tatlockia sp.]|nr:SdpI family protein [Tatlockia sp.]
MAKQPKLNDSIHEFNQDILGRELTAALIIKNQLRALTDDLLNNQHITEEVKVKVLASADKTIKAMLDAESKEIFIIHRRKFVQLLVNLKEKFSLQGDLDKALKDYRAYLEIHRILQDMTPEKQANLPRWFLDHPEYKDWQEKLNQVKKSDDFDFFKNELMAQLILVQPQENLANLASLSRINQYDRILSDTRLSYLKEATNNRKILIDLVWIVGGILLGGAGAVLGFAFPALVIPGIAIGAAALGHGTIDFIKTNGSLWSKMSLAELGDREISFQTKSKIQHKFPDFKVEEFLTYQEQRKQNWLSERNWQRGLGYAVAFAGFLFALAGLIAALPAIGIPLAGVIAITAVGFAITVIALGVWGYKVASDKEKLDAVRKEVDEGVVADTTMISDSISMHKEDKLSSNAKMFLESKRLLEEEQNLQSEEEQNLQSIEIVKLDPELFQDKPELKPEKQREGKKEKDIAKDEEEEGEGEAKTPSNNRF